MAKITTKRIVATAIMLTIALLLGIIEQYFPPIFPFAPNVKLGLSNIIIILSVILLSIFDSYLILILKCIMVAIFSGNISSIMYSLPAGVVSLTVMVVFIVFAIDKISIVTISLFGAISHNIIQLTIASIITKTSLMYMTPLFLLASTIAGVGVGIVVYFLIKSLPQKAIGQFIS